MKDTKKRNVTADVLRGFAIITVVLGHCIQEGNGLEYYNNSMYWGNKLYQFIYSFHMPLFMILAGWFAFYSIGKAEGNRKQQWKLLASKLVIYIVPIAFWTLFEFVRGYYLNVKLGNETTGFPQIIPLYLKTFATNLWFLWAVAICFTIVFFMHYYLKDNVVLYIVLFLLMFFITDDYNLAVYKYMMPYYVAAFYINMHKDKMRSSKVGKFLSDLYENKKVLCVLASGIVFGILFLFYRERAFIYLSGYRLSRATLISQGIVDMYRMIIGFAGSLFFILLFDFLVEKTAGYKWPVLSLFGRNSLGVYILQGYYILMVMVNYTNDCNPSGWLVVTETAAVCAASLVTAVILGNIPIVKSVVGKKVF